MRILLTGGAGFFCTRFYEYYKGRHELLSTDKDTLDICNSAEIGKQFSAFKPDIVIHAAAIAVTDFCNKNPVLAHQINVDGAVNVAYAAKECGAKLVFISSEQVFNGNVNAGPYSETDVAVPNTVYGQNKLEAEHLLEKIIPELWIVRFTWMFGLPHRNCAMSRNILWDTLADIMRGKKISASPNEFRGMTYVWEMVEGFEKLFSFPYGIYHLGAENSYARYDIVQRIFGLLDISERAEELLIADITKYSDSPRDVRLNTGKAGALGLCFSDTANAIEKCLSEYGMALKK